MTFLFYFKAFAIMVAKKILLFACLVEDFLLAKKIIFGNSISTVQIV